MTDPRLARYVKALIDEGCAPGNGIHSWRCAYPDIYGECNCVEEVALVLMALADEDVTRAFAQGQQEAWAQAGRWLR